VSASTLWARFPPTLAPGTVAARAGGPVTRPDGVYHLGHPKKTRPTGRRSRRSCRATAAARSRPWLLPRRRPQGRADRAQRLPVGEALAPHHRRWPPHGRARCCPCRLPSPSRSYCSEGSATSTLYTKCIDVMRSVSVGLIHGEGNQGGSSTREAETSR
jgi:hypothetical protein